MFTPRNTQLDGHAQYLIQAALPYNFRWIPLFDDITELINIHSLVHTNVTSHALYTILNDQIFSLSFSWSIYFLDSETRLNPKAHYTTPIELFYNEKVFYNEFRRLIMPIEKEYRETFVVKDIKDITAKNLKNFYIAYNELCTLGMCK